MSQNKTKPKRRYSHNIGGERGEDLRPIHICVCHFELASHDCLEENPRCLVQMTQSVENQSSLSICDRNKIVESTSRYPSTGMTCISQGEKSPNIELIVLWFYTRPNFEPHISGFGSLLTPNEGLNSFITQNIQ